MINDLKDFKKLLQICRSQGITELELNGIKVKFGELEDKKSSSIMTEDDLDINPYDGLPNRILSPAELEMLAHGGDPDSIPEIPKEYVS